MVDVIRCSNVLAPSVQTCYIVELLIEQKQRYNRQLAGLCVCGECAYATRLVAHIEIFTISSEIVVSKLPIVYSSVFVLFFH